MATYVISDIHGEYEKFMELLEEIELEENDTLYVLGDVLDRGEHPIKTVLKLMEMPNAICLVGNHEVMALECLRFLCQEITDLAIEEVDAELLVTAEQCNAYDFGTDTGIPCTGSGDAAGSHGISGGF